MSNVTLLYSDITDVNTKVPREILRAFVSTNKAFEAVMSHKDESNHARKNREKQWKTDVTVLDLPTYQHLPSEFLELSDAQKSEFIRELCIQNGDISTGNNKKWESDRNAYISELYLDSIRLLVNHLHVEIPNKFAHVSLASAPELLDFMNMKISASDSKSSLYHCMLLKSMFLMHVIQSTIDLESLPRILNAIRQKIEDHRNITVLNWNEPNGKMQIAYNSPGNDKPKIATITFWEKDISAIFDKLARKAAYMSPDMLNDLARMNVEFEEDKGDDVARKWLINELIQIAFWKNSVEIEMSTKEGQEPIVSPDILWGGVVEKNIPDVHNIQITGKINDKLPSVRWVQSFEVMCTSKHVDWNAEGIGNRKIYKVERLQQAFSRLTTGAYGILKPGQVKYALREYAKKEGLKETPEELLSLLLGQKWFLIPVNMFHGTSLCYRVRGVYRSEAEKLSTLKIEDLDSSDPKIFGKLMKQFKTAKVVSPAHINGDL